MQAALETKRNIYLAKFNALFVKELLIKVVAGLVKENPATYFSEEPLDFAKIEPSQVFQHIVQFLRDVMKQVSRELGLEDESRVYLALVVLKERLAMFMLTRTLEVLRDIVLLMPLS